MNAARIVLWVAVVAVVLIILILNPELISFSADNVADYVNMMAPLVLIALFIERALEVFITVWRGPDAAKKDLEIRQLRSGGSKNAITLMQSKEQEFLDYKTHTQKIAFSASVAVGIVISALGIRALEMFLDQENFAELSNTQQSLFRIIDVLITGALLGGGADGIHKIVSTFTTYMDKTKRNMTK